MRTKKEYKIFTICEYEKEQEYLRAMHRSGWRFVKLSPPCVYRFEKCEPEDVIYQLDYNKEGIEHKDEYVKLFSDCGWEYLQDFAGYSYFRKVASEVNGSEGIFCDDASRLQMLERIFNGRVIPLFVIFSCSLVPSFIISLLHSSCFIAGFLGLLIILYITIFITFAVKYFDVKRSIR